MRKFRQQRSPTKVRKEALQDDDPDVVEGSDAWTRLFNDYAARLRKMKKEQYLNQLAEEEKWENEANEVLNKTRFWRDKDLSADRSCERLHASWAALKERRAVKRAERSQKMIENFPFRPFIRKRPGQ